MIIRRSREEIAVNRQRYEEHQKKGLEFAPKVMPAPSTLPAPNIEAGRVIHQEIIPGGWYWSTIVKRGEAIRVSQDAGQSSIALIAWNAADTSERLNLPDTVKLQWTTAITKGRVIFSDMGRVMFSVIEDTSGAHDALMGGSTAASNAATYPTQKTRNSRDNFVLMAGKLGLTRRDIPVALTLFAPVRVTEDGAFQWRPELSRDGDYIELRAEMDLLVGLSNCPHPFDPKSIYAPQPVTVTRFHPTTPGADDHCRTATAEAVRGFENNAIMLA